MLYLGSEPFWPERTLAENFCNRIDSAPADLDGERLAESLWMADAEPVLASLPLGMQTTLSQDGHVLSRGENQRLFLAMALYRRPPILILDESLSHVASRSVRAILQRLGESSLGSLIVHVTQRPGDHPWSQRKIGFEARS